MESCMAFLDLSKAFDFVNLDVLWKILTKYGCPEKFVNILHEGIITRVHDSSSNSEPFEVQTGVKQGRVTCAPTLFCIFISEMFQLKKDKCPKGVTIPIVDGDWKTRKQKPVKTSVIELQYADANNVCVTSHDDIKAILKAILWGAWVA